MPSRVPLPFAARALSAAVLLALPCAAGDLAAQASAPPAGGPYERARLLVESGRGEAGRALVDSLIAAATAGSPAYAEALWWRAVLAAEGVPAERDLRTLVAEYPASPRAVDATLRLAQLDLSRGRPADARERLERLRREQPEAPTQARAGYWLSRAQLDGGDPRAACTTLNAAAAAAVPGDAVARQVVALRRRLPGCELTVAIGRGTAEDSAAAPAAGAPPRATDATAGTPPPTPRDAPPTAATPPAAVPAAAPAAAPAAPAGAGGYTVQLAAYDTRADADAFVGRLVARGLEARVAGTSAPFRVRVGRWARRADAVAAQRDLARQGFRGGWVADAEPAAPAP